MKEKLYKLVKTAYLIIKYVFINIRKYLIKSRIRLAKRNWFLSKNRNFYNPILESTVYKYGHTWSIARHGNYWGGFSCKEDAMDEVFQMWLDDKGIMEIANEIDDELKNIKHKILNEHKYRILDKQLEEGAKTERKFDTIKALKPKRIMIFGRPGSGKSTFAAKLSRALGLPLNHLDKHFFVKDWVERDYNEFLQIQQNMVNNEHWIIDGNSTRSLEIRWSKADLVLYFNFSKFTCLLRIFKRFFNPNKSFDDRAPGCNEVIRLPYLKYMWWFEERVDRDIRALKERYPHVVFKEIADDNYLAKLENDMF